MTFQTDALATSPVRYWPLNETSGTNANELVAGDDGTAVGITMGGADGPEGIGGKAPLFTGATSEYIQLKTAAILGGTASWSVAAWVRYSAASSGDATVRSFYSEKGTSGNDLIRCAVKDGNASSLSLGYGNDAGTLTRDSAATYILGGWHFVVMTRTGATYGLWYDAGGRLGGSDLGATNTWTNSGIEARISTNVGASNTWIGRVAHLLLYDRVVTVDEMWDLYQAGTPLTRTLTTRRYFFHPTTSVWRQRLDDPSNPPLIASNSAVLSANFVAQMGLSAPSISTAGPLYTVDNTIPTQAVRIMGGNDGNPSTDKPALWNALQQVPIPTPFNSDQDTTDHGATIYNEQSDELFDFWIMEKKIKEPAFVSAVKDNATPGTLPAGNYGIYVAGTYGAGVSFFKGLLSAYSSDGTHAVRINWSPSEGADGYNVYVSSTGFGFSTARLVAHTNASTFALTYNGTPYPGTNLMTAEPPTVTPDWACSYGGYQADCDNWVGHYVAPRANWGQTATSMPTLGGFITIESAVAAREGDIDAIEHAHTMALLQSTNTHVYPAQRHDFWGGSYAIPEGTRIQLDPTIDPTTVSALPFVQAYAKALQVYGGYICDHSGGIAVGAIEGSVETGRNPYPYIFSGRQLYELFTGFPWSSVRVIDPAWTQAQAGTLPSPPGLTPYWGIRL